MFSAEDYITNLMKYHLDGEAVFLEVFYLEITANTKKTVICFN